LGFAASSLGLGCHGAWLVESEYNAATDPVVLWLTGGPGCSSMDAFIYENGPFRFSYAKGGEYIRSEQLQRHINRVQHVACLQQ
jgi:hypothetical protein